MSDLPPALRGVQLPAGLLEAVTGHPLPNYIVRCVDGRLAAVVHHYLPVGKAIVNHHAMTVEDFDEFVTEGRSLPRKYEWHEAQRLLALAKEWALTAEDDPPDHVAAGCGVDKWGCHGGCCLEEKRRAALRTALTPVSPMGDREQ